MADTIFDLQARVSADVSPFNKAMDTSADSVTSSLKTIHQAANTFIGSGVVKSFVKATEAAYGFSQAMADISAISDVNIKHLSNSIAKLDNVYGKMSHVGDTIYEMISSGIRGTEADYVHAVKSIGQASVSIKADLYDTANTVTTLLNAYNMSVKDIDKISDMLFVTVREGKAHGNELAKTLGLVTNTAAEAGVSFAELSAAISILSRTQTASQSMIGLNQLLNGLIKPTIEAKAEAEKWGIEIGATALKTKGLTAILTEMHDKIGGNVEAINRILGNIRAMRAGVALTGKQFDNFIEVLRTAESEIGTGVAFKAFEKQTATAQQSLKNLKTQVDKTFITFGQDFEPATQKIVTAAELYLKTLTGSDNIVRRGLLYASAIILAYKGAASAVRVVKSVIRSASEGSKGMADNAKGFTKSISELNDKHLPETEASFKRIQAIILQTANTLNMIKTRIGFVSGLAAAQQVDKALHTIRTKDVRAQAEANLGISLDRKKYALRNAPLADLKDKAFMTAIRMAGWREADFFNPDTKSLAMRNLGFSAKDLEQPKLMSMEERHKKAMQAAYPKKNPAFVAANRFSKNLDVATAALTAFSQSVNAVKTKMTAAFLPDANRVAMRRTYMSHDEIEAIVQRNVRMAYAPIYRKNNAGEYEEDAEKLRDTLTGHEVYREGIERVERSRIEDIASKQRAKVRYEARKQDEENLKAEARYNKALEGFQKTDLANVKQYNENKKALEDEIVQLEKSRADALLAARAAVDKEEKRYQMAVAREARDRSRVARKMIEIAERQKQEQLRILEEMQKERTEIALSRKQAALARYNRRYHTNYETTADIRGGWDTRNQAAAGLTVLGRKASNLAKPVWAGMARVAGGLNFLTMAVTTAVEGFQMGKAIGEHLGLADLEIVKFIGDLRAGKWGKKSSDEEAKDVDTYNKESKRRLIENTVSRLAEDKKISKVAAQELLVRAHLTETLEDLDKMYKEIIAEYGKKEDKPIAKHPNEVRNQASRRTIDALKDFDFDTVEADKETIKSIDAIIKSAGLSNVSAGMLKQHYMSKDWQNQLKITENMQKSMGEAVWNTLPNITRLNHYFNKDALVNYYGVAESNRLLGTAEKLRNLRRASANRKTDDARKELIASLLAEEYNDVVDERTEWAKSHTKAYNTDQNKAMENLYTSYTKGNIDNIASDVAFADVRGAYESYSKLLKAFEYLKSELRDYDTIYADVDPKLRERNKNAAKQQLGVMARALYRQEQDLESYAETYHTKGVDSIDNYAKSLLAKGISEASDVYIEKTGKAINAKLIELYAVLNQTTNDDIAAYYKGLITKLEDKRSSLSQDMLDRRSSRRQDKVSAGMRDESYAIRGDIKDLKALAASYSNALEGLKASKASARTAETREFYSKRIADVNRRLLDTNIKLNGKFKELSESTLQLRSNLLSTASEFASQRNARGKMSNQGLWHSVNLMARVSGAGMKGSMPYTVSAGATYNRASMAKSREKAQSQISASIDSWIMSQKYAEANTGRAVLDIRNKLMQDNYIMVRK